jgi:SAM-dependent methyltransferase
MSVKRKKLLAINQSGWNVVAPKFYAGTALPRYGPLAVTEGDLQLIEDLEGKSILELGCGSGHSLRYLWTEKHAAELWGLDLSEEQLRFTRELLDRDNIPVKLFQASMDEDPGLPASYFDLVLSIYSLGWTPDLPRTLSLVYSYLKPGGTFLFSWEHPFYQCVDYDTVAGKYFLARSYLNEDPDFHPSWNGVEIVLQPRMLSTYLNALVEAGLVLDRIVESEVNKGLARKKSPDPEEWYSIPRAELVPTTMIVKAHKPA